MQQCDSRYVVKYYGSYFKNSDLWSIFLPIISILTNHKYSSHHGILRRWLCLRYYAFAAEDSERTGNWSHNARHASRPPISSFVKENTQRHKGRNQIKMS